MELCKVPAGSFRMGSEDTDEEAYSNEKPAHDLEIPYDFSLSRYPVTVGQWRQYLTDCRREPGDPDSLRGVGR